MSGGCRGRRGNSIACYRGREWEYSARAGTTGPFHFGDTISTDQANYNGNYAYPYGSGRRGLYREKTVPVGSFPANDFGLHDMHGNVWEWVEDCWHDSYSGAPSDGERMDDGRRVQQARFARRVLGLHDRWTFAPRYRYW